MATHRHLLLVPLLGIAALARADVPADTRKAIEERYHQMSQAYVRQDIAGIERVFAPDCTLKLEGEGMTVRLKQYLQGTKDAFKVVRVRRSRTRITAIDARNDTVVATAVWTGEATYSSLVRPAKGGKPAVGKPTQTTVDTWQKTARGWQIRKRLVKASR